jgi:hypothetical protein
MEMDRRTSSLSTLAGACGLAAVLVGTVSGYLFLAAGGFDVSAAVDFRVLLETSTGSLLRWASLTDMFGYYLLLIPFFVGVGDELRRERPGMLDLFTLGGVLYAAFGAIGAVILASAGALLVDAYAVADPADRAVVAVTFGAVAEGVRAIWQILEPIPLGVWAVGTGAILRDSRPVLGVIGIAFGMTAWFWSAMTMMGLAFELSAVVVLLAPVFGLLFWVFVVWLALLLLRGRALSRSKEQEASSAEDLQAG